jgi:hypothetical protein
VWGWGEWLRLRGRLRAAVVPISVPVIAQEDFRCWLTKKMLIVAGILIRWQPVPGRGPRRRLAFREGLSHLPEALANRAIPVRSSPRDYLQPSHHFRHLP